MRYITFDSQFSTLDEPDLVYEQPSALLAQLPRNQAAEGLIDIGLYRAHRYRLNGRFK